MKILSLMLVMILLVACKEDQASPGNNVLQVGYNETVSAEISGTTWEVTFLSIEENSLCPEDVVCIWQGRMIVKLQIRSAIHMNSQTSLLGIGDLNNTEQDVQNSIVTNGSKITLIEASDFGEASTTTIKLQFD